MRRTLLLALTPLTALALTLAPGASAEPPQAALDMSGAFNEDCTQERGAEFVTGNCQGGALAESFIADAFLTGTVTLRKQSFVIGPKDLLEKNAANGAGQVVEAPKKPGYEYLQVLVATVNENDGKGGLFTITYTDGSTEKVMLETLNWGGNAGEAAWEGEKQGALHLPTGGSKSWLFVEQLPLNPNKAVASVKLPDKHGGLRVFAMTLSNTSSELKGPVFR